MRGNSCIVKEKTTKYLGKRGRKMLEVKFYEEVDDQLLEFAVIVSKYKGKWVYCKHRERDTYEAPGGHRDNGENIIETAKRELFEETGAKKFKLTRIGVYSVSNEGKETFGMLFFADIEEFGELPEMEIEKIELFDKLPDKLTYPLIQPKLVERVATEIQKLKLLE